MTKRELEGEKEGGGLPCSFSKFKEKCPDLA